jgi:hypothetical protein
MYNTSLSGVPWDMSAWRDREKFRASGHLFSSTLFISLFCDCKIPERTSIYLSLVKSLLFHLSRAGYEVDRNLVSIPKRSMDRFNHLDSDSDDEAQSFSQSSHFP